MKKIFYIMVIGLFTSLAFSTEWTNYGLNVQTFTNLDDVTQTVLQDSKGNVFRVSSVQDIADARVQRIISLKDFFYSWTNLVIHSIDFTVSENQMDIVIQPEKLFIENTNAAAFLPAGMLFYDSGDLYYDFRMKRNNLFMRVSGKYKDGQDFDIKMSKAVTDPSGYLRMIDPDARIEAMEDDIAELRDILIAMFKKGSFEGASFLPDTITMKIMDLKKANPKWGKKEIAKALESDESLKKVKIQVSEKDVSAVLSVYYHEFQ